jgi:hypothetical protein
MTGRAEEVAVPLPETTAKYFPIVLSANLMEAR